MPSPSPSSLLTSLGTRPARLIHVLAAVVLISCLILLLIAPLRVNHDVALFLIMAEKLIDGAVPYVDYLTINFPMAQYVHLPAVALARAVQVNPIPVFNLGVLL